MLGLPPRGGRRLRAALAQFVTGGGDGGGGSAYAGSLGGSSSRRRGGGGSAYGVPPGATLATVAAARRVVGVGVAAVAATAAAVWLLTGAAAGGGGRAVGRHPVAAGAQRGAPATAATGLRGAADAPVWPWPPVRRPVTLRPVPRRRSPPTALQERVVAATRSAWAAYAAAAWGADELLPVTASARDYWHLGLTILDAADTLFLLGLADEYAAARAWVAGPALADFHLDANVSVFETTIRALGGLLGAYTVSAEGVWLERAVQLGDRLLPAFDTPSGIPHSNLNLASGRQTHGTHPAEALSLGLEFRTLTYLTGDGRYAAAVGRLAATVERGWPADGLLGNTLDVETGAFGGNTYTAGNRVDSAYEYLAKQCLLLGGGGAGCVAAIRAEGSGGGGTDHHQMAPAVRQRLDASGSHAVDAAATAANSAVRFMGRTAAAAALAAGGRGHGRIRTDSSAPTAAEVRSEAAHYGRLFLRSAESINARLVTTSPGGRVLLEEVSRYSGRAAGAGMDHLACFWPGVLALAAWSGLDDLALRSAPPSAAAAAVTAASTADADQAGQGADGGDLPSSASRAAVPAVVAGLGADGRGARWGWARLAAALTDTCAAMSASTRTGLAPEGVLLLIDPGSGREQLQPRPGGVYNVLRPEAAEALFLLHRTTTNISSSTTTTTGGGGDGDGGGAAAAAAVAAGAQILDAFDAVSRLPATGAYASVVDVTADPAAAAGSPTAVRHFSAMESFFLAETLKYLYLLFEAPAGGKSGGGRRGEEADPVLLPLDRYVFNTEAHPLPVFEMDTWGEEVEG